MSDENQKDNKPSKISFWGCLLPFVFGSMFSWRISTIVILTVIIFFLCIAYYIVTKIKDKK